MIFHLIFGPFHLKSAEKVLELKPLEKRIGLLGKNISQPCPLNVIVYIRVHTDSSQSLAHDRHVPVLLQSSGSSGRLQLIHVLIGVFYGMILRYDLGRRLLANAGNSRNIVRGIPHQGLHVDKLMGRHAVLLLHVRRVVVLDLCSPSFRLGDADLGVVRGKLQKVPVPADDGDFHPRGLASSRDGAQQVVRLQASLFDDPDAHSRQNLLHHRHLLAQLLCHGLSRPLVVRVHLVAEGGGVYVKCHSQIFRLLLLQYLQHNVEEAVDGICVEPLGVSQIRESEKCPVQYTVSINQYYLFSHSFSPFFCQPLSIQTLLLFTIQQTDIF